MLHGNIYCLVSLVYDKTWLLIEIEFLAWDIIYIW
jgi:hypothetical protein